MHNKVSVCYSVKEVEAFLMKYKRAKFCLYLAHKTKEEWARSTSRVYMNKIDEGLVYLPVDIKKEDYSMIKDIYKLSEESSQIVAINQTQPHKSNLVLKEWFKGQDVPTNIDAMIKDKNGKLQPFDINGPSFIGWFEAEVGSFEGKQVVILGVGGVGEPIARMLSKRQPQEMFLVDVVSKQGLAEELGCVYSASLENVSDLSGEVVFINCAGKEGASEAGAEDFLKKYKARGNVFVDLRPHLDILIVEEAKYLGWKAYTGFGMNARNDYALLSKICELVGVNVLLFNDFKELVAGAS